MNYLPYVKINFFLLRFKSEAEFEPTLYVKNETAAALH